MHSIGILIDLQQVAHNNHETEGKCYMVSILEHFSTSFAHPEIIWSYESEFEY